MYRYGLVAALFVFSIIFNPLLHNVSASNSNPPQNPSVLAALPVPDIQIVTGVIKKGDTASTLFNDYLPMKIILKVYRESKQVFSFNRFRTGQPYKIMLQENRLIGFEYEINKADRLIIRKENETFSIKREPIKVDVKLEVISATIKSSLFESMRLLGEKSTLADSLSDIFAWDIDFIKGIRSGDHYKILVEKRYRKGKLFGYGDIQAAFFSNAGNLYKAFLHRDADGVAGYYDEKGKSLQKAFLKAPLNYSKITSKFTRKRLHPIFKVYKSHPGVDYAAPRGTPIKTVGDGVIIKIGYNKGMGKYINIRHNNGYITEYNHMSGFAPGMKKNKRVVQSDIIGYVGKTGYATGPHLDFRMSKNGIMLDPLKHKSPKATPVNPAEMKIFLAKTAELSARILMAKKSVASNKKTT